MGMNIWGSKIPMHSNLRARLWWFGPHSPPGSCCRCPSIGRGAQYPGIKAMQKFMRMQKFMDFRELTWPEGTWTWVSPPCSWHAQHFSMPSDQAKIWMFMWKCKKTCLCSWILPVSQLLSLVPVPQLLPHWISLDMWWNMETLIWMKRLIWQK